MEMKEIQRYSPGSATRETNRMNFMFSSVSRQKVVTHRQHHVSPCLYRACCGGGQELPAKERRLRRKIVPRHTGCNTHNDEFQTMSHLDDVNVWPVTAMETCSNRTKKISCHGARRR